MKTLLAIVGLLVVLVMGMFVGKFTSIVKTTHCSLFSGDCNVSYSVHFGATQIFTIGE